MAAYCTWADVQAILERASEIIPAALDQTAEVEAATEMADYYLAPLMPVPVHPSSANAYPAFVVRFTAHLCANEVAKRRYHGDDDTYSADYDGHLYTGTKWGHMAMSMIQARRQAKMASPDEVTPADVVEPNLRLAFVDTNGTIQVKYAAGFFQDDKRAVYTFTITSVAGNVVDGTLTVSCTRDGGAEDIWGDHAVTSSGWNQVQFGLMVRFIDADTGSNWEETETFTVTCEPADDVKSEGVRSVEWNLG